MKRVLSVVFQFLLYLVVFGIGSVGSGGVCVLVWDWAGLWDLSGVEGG